MCLPVPILHMLPAQHTTPKLSGFQTMTIFFLILTDSLGQEFRQGTKGMVYLCSVTSGTLAEKTRRLGVTPKVGGTVAWSFLSCHFWCLGCSDLKTRTADQSTYMWPLHVTWAPSQHGSFGAAGNLAWLGVFQWAKVGAASLCMTQPQKSSSVLFPTLFQWPKQSQGFVIEISGEICSAS